MTADNNYPLSPYRVLDLTDENGYLCGKMLADLGADVVKIEKPGGDPGRRLGPFYHDVPDPEKSLSWFAFNLNKRGITLDIATRDGAALFLKLVKTADFVLESFPTGYLGSLGLDYSALSAGNERIIMTSITPFGQTGPRQHWKGADIVGMATGGFMYMAGDPALPPVRVSVDQACLHASAEAAVASLIADYERQRSGRGQHIDVSISASVVSTVIAAIQFWDIYRVTLKRSGAFRAGHLKSGKPHQQQWECKDGFVSFALLGGAAGAASNKALVEWMASEGMASDAMKGMDWKKYDFSTVDYGTVKSFEGQVARFFLSHTKDEIYRGALARRILVYPVNSIEELVNSPQLHARESWAQVEHPELNTVITYPGAFAKSTAVKFPAHRRAPRIGEHNIEVYEGELGLTRAELIMLKEVGVI